MYSILWFLKTFSEFRLWLICIFSTESQLLPLITDKDFANTTYFCIHSHIILSSTYFLCQWYHYWSSFICMQIWTCFFLFFFFCFATSLYRTTIILLTQQVQRLWVARILFRCNFYSYEYLSANALEILELP